jgi:hypothetical protein
LPPLAITLPAEPATEDVPALPALPLRPAALGEVPPAPAEPPAGGFELLLQAKRPTLNPSIKPQRTTSNL